MNKKEFVRKVIEVAGWAAWEEPGIPPTIWGERYCSWKNNYDYIKLQEGSVFNTPLVEGEIEGEKFLLSYEETWDKIIAQLDFRELIKNAVDFSERSGTI